MQRHVCVRYRFLQPPGEDSRVPALKAQNTADPHSDRNRLVTRKYDWPNRTAGILDKLSRIPEIAKNYFRAISNSKIDVGRGGGFHGL